MGLQREYLEYMGIVLAIFPLMYGFIIVQINTYTSPGVNDSKYNTAYEVGIWNRSDFITLLEYLSLTM